MGKEITNSLSWTMRSTVVIVLVSKVAPAVVTIHAQTRQQVRRGRVHAAS